MILNQKLIDAIPSFSNMVKCILNKILKNYQMFNEINDVLNQFYRN